MLQRIAENIFLLSPIRVLLELLRAVLAQTVAAPAGTTPAASTEAEAMDVVTFWCPCLGTSVQLETDIEEHTNLPTIQSARPRRCLHLREKGCTYSQDPQCLVGKEIQGNFLRRMMAS